MAVINLNPYEVQRTLIKVAKTAYPEARIKPFTLEVCIKESGTRHGDWTLKKGRIPRIRILNLSNPPSRIIVTPFHEMAHHMEWSILDKHGHSKDFYAIYKKLLETGHGMAEVDLASLGGESDIALLVKKAGPLKFEQVARRSFVRVGDGYAVRDRLKADGFSYSQPERAWTKETTDPEELARRVAGYGAKQVTVSDRSMIEPVYFVITRERPPLPGFAWRKGVGWFKRFPAQEAVQITRDLARQGIVAQHRGQF